MSNVENGRDNAVAKLGTQDIANFKMPSAVVPRKKKKVLDEDAYISKLETIIQRDFFPDLNKLQVQASYLEALESNDISKLREIYEKYSVGPTIPDSHRGGASPATFETPTRDFADNESVHSSASKSCTSQDVRDVDDSLDEFLFKHTSEDNESFEEMMDDAKRKHRLKYSWLYNSEKDSQSKQDTCLALPSIEKQAVEDTSTMVDTWKYRVHNSIMYVPDGAPLSMEEKVKLTLDKEHIVHGNTHFLGNPFDESRNREAVRQAAQLQSNTREGHVDVDGKEIKSSTAPTVNGFSFMKTPSPAPGVTDSPLMTWGEIEGTPFRLDGSDTPLPSGHAGSSFHLQKLSERDRIGLKLAEKVGQGYRDRRGRNRPGGTTSVTSPYTTSVGTISQRIASMSPAARNLATSRLGIRLSTDRALQASYTPRPRRSAGDDTPTPRRRSLTPSPRTPHSISRANLTDNLLQLPKRSKAKDYF